LEHVNNAVEVEVEATSIPAKLDLDMEGLAAGASLYASDVKLPEGVTLASDPKMIVVHLSVRVAVEEAAATPAAAEGGEAASSADAGDSAKS
jgi:large subunit ribosomal protein L25